jgi:TetR/AcrR family acrAB operon transcriptional repressor
MSEPAPQTQPARSERAQRTRQRILDAAGACFAGAGFSKTTVEEIAAAAGVSKGIVYHHFRGKEDVLESLLERTLEEWALASALDDRMAGGDSVQQAIAGMMRSSLEYARTNPLVRALFQLDPLVVMGLGSSSAVRRSIEEGRQRMVEAVRRGVALGELRDDLDPERTADVVRMMSMALLEHLLNPEWIDASDERLVDTSLEVLFHGIGSLQQ